MPHQRTSPPVVCALKRGVSRNMSASALIRNSLCKRTCISTSTFAWMRFICVSINLCLHASVLVCMCGCACVCMYVCIKYLHAEFPECVLYMAGCQPVHVYIHLYSANVCVFQKILCLPAMRPRIMCIRMNKCMCVRTYVWGYYVHEVKMLYRFRELLAHTYTHIYIYIHVMH